jgi:pimeloyl-ACP methyl ester carboxylesterase
MTEIRSFDGLIIYFEVIGDETIPLVFVGGWASATGKLMWQYQLPTTSIYKVILVDLAGHGKSSIDREFYTMQSFGKDVQSVIEYLDLHNVILIGHSMGGAVILETATLIPDRIRGINPYRFPISEYK